MEYYCQLFVHVKSSGVFGAFQTGSGSVAQWTPASQKNQVREGRECWFLAVLTDSFQRTNMAKSHKEKKQHRKKWNTIKKFQETMKKLIYFLCKPCHRTCKAFFCRLLNRNRDMRQALLQLSHKYKCKGYTSIKGLAHGSPHHPPLTALGHSPALFTPVDFSFMFSHMAVHKIPSWVNRRAMLNIRKKCQKTP